MAVIDVDQLGTFFKVQNLVVDFVHGDSLVATFKGSRINRSGIFRYSNVYRYPNKENLLSNTCCSVNKAVSRRFAQKKMRHPQRL